MQEHRQCVLLPVQGDEPSPSLYEAGGANGGCPAEAKLEEDAEQDIWQEAQPRLGHTQPSRPQIIAQRLRESQETQEIIIKAMNQLRGRGKHLAATARHKRIPKLYRGQRAGLWIHTVRALAATHCHDITLSRGCLIAGLPLILAERSGHHYKSMGWSLFHEIT